jgi:hypothetical protein
MDNLGAPKWPAEPVAVRRDLTTCRDDPQTELASHSMDLIGQGFDRSGLSCRADAPTGRPYPPHRNRPARSDGPEAAGVGDQFVGDNAAHRSDDKESQHPTAPVIHSIVRVDCVAESAKASTSRSARSTNPTAVSSPPCYPGRRAACRRAGGCHATSPSCRSTCLRARGYSAGAIASSQVRIGAVGSVEGLFNSA